MDLEDSKLVDIEQRLSNILQQCNLDSFVSVDNIKKWIKEMDDGDSMMPLNVLTGLLDKKSLVNEDLFQDLVNTTINLSHFLPAKKPNSETFSDTIKKRREQGKPLKLSVIKTTTFPPTKWTNHYHKAMYHIHKQNFLQASKEFDKTFKTLLKTKTTSQDIYRVFCNAGVSYMFSGEPLLGINCIEIAHELNPQYAFASKQLHRFRQGEFDDTIRLGMLLKMQRNIEKWEKRPDHLKLNIVMNWSEKKILKKLSEFGVFVNKQKFIKVSKTVNHPGKLAEKLFYPQTHVTGDDEDYIWIAAYALWNIYCPDEPSIVNFNDVLHDAFTFISKTKNKKKSREAYEKTCAKYIKRMQPYIFSEKKAFLKEWQETIDGMEYPVHELKIFLISLLAFHKLENGVLKIVHHLNKKIPHPDWITVEIISNIIHDSPKGDELYKEFKRDYPFYCYVPYDLAQYYLEKEDYLHAEFYLMDALEIIDHRVKKNKLSIDTVDTTIYDDYTNVFDLLEKVLEKSNADPKKKKLLADKKRAVEKKSEIYSRSPKFEKIDKATNELIFKMETDRLENSNAFQYYNFLTQLDVNFETEKPIKTDEHVLEINPKRHLDQEKSKRKHHHDKKYTTKIGRNDPCPCGSGKKYKRCCLEKDRKRMMGL